VGYSSTVAASESLDMLVKKYTPPGQTMYLVNGKEYFPEIGRENQDGAMTGTIYLALPKDINGKEYLKKVGGFRVNDNGFIVRFPPFSKNVINEHNMRFREYAKTRNYGFGYKSF
jgi:hypothetical protein